MSEDEIIKEIYNILKTFEVESEKAFDTNYKNNESYQAIQGLLDLYQQEKEAKESIYEDYQDYICKDKIKTKIDEMNSLKHSDERLDRATIDFVINKFYRLLEEE